MKVLLQDDYSNVEENFSIIINYNFDFSEEDEDVEEENEGEPDINLDELISSIDQCENNNIQLQEKIDKISNEKLLKVLPTAQALYPELNLEEIECEENDL